jgi:hypothetical protein
MAITSVEGTMEEDMSKVPVWSAEPVGTCQSKEGVNRLLPLRDGSLLLLNTHQYKPSRVFRTRPGSMNMARVKHPGDANCWFVDAPPGRLLMGESDGERCVLWDPVSGASESIPGTVPHCDTACADVYDGRLYIVLNWNVSGSSAGFDWSDDDTHLGVFNLKKGRFKKPFHQVEDHDLRSIVMQSRKQMIGFGYGRSNAFYGLFDTKLKYKDSGRKKSMNFWPSHYMSTHYIGTDAERAMVIFGSKGNSEERAVMRWSMKAKTFQTVATISDTDLFFRCSVTLNDGSILIFCWERFTENQVIFRYALGEPFECVGRLEDCKIECAAQGSDGKVYIAGHGSVQTISP